MRINRYYTLLQLLFLFPCFVFAQPTEEQKIQTLLEEAAKDFITLPFAEVAKKWWILDDASIYMISMLDGTHFFLKKDEILDMTHPPQQEDVDFKRFNFTIIVDGNVAYAYNDARAIRKDDTLYFHEIRGFKKVNGIWKIHVASFHQFMNLD
jgi:hypothetical protein